METITDVRERVKRLAGVDTSEHDDNLDELLTLMLQDVADYCNRSFDTEDLPAGVMLYLVDVFQASERDTGIKSKKMGDVTITYTAPEDASEQARKRLRKYRKLRFTS